MEFAIVTVPAAPVRRKANHRREMVNQLLFGESVRIVKTKGELWIKVRSLHDGYEGWMTRTLVTPADETIASMTSTFVVADLIAAVVIDKSRLQVPVGSSLPFYELNTESKNGTGRIGDRVYSFSGKVCKRDAVPASSELLLKLTAKWLNAPYLWGGRTPLGVDCSGFVQVIFKMMGIDLPRDAWQQAQQGRSVKKYRDAQSGDLVFFNNKEDIVHVGILIGGDQVIHSSGKVRIDKIDKKGIINTETGKRGLRLRAIRRLW